MYRVDDPLTQKLMRTHTISQKQPQTKGPLKQANTQTNVQTHTCISVYVLIWMWSQVRVCTFWEDGVRDVVCMDVGPQVARSKRFPKALQKDNLIQSCLFRAMRSHPHVLERMSMYVFVQGGLPCILHCIRRSHKLHNGHPRGSRM